VRKDGCSAVSGRRPGSDACSDYDGFARKRAPVAY
jgi:hypothetical protein